VGDLAGYAAATWMRGVDWVVVPTTLLAMVDSSIGGKTGHNHPRAKNMIGAFHQPRLVVADVDVLGSLPPRQLRAGAYEALKTGFLGDRSLVERFEQAPAGLRGWDPDVVEKVVTAAATVKADVVSRDEREGDFRRILNLGHTVGHALEAVTAYRRFTHGEAVGWGMLAAAAIARHRGLISERLAERIRAAVDRIGPRPRVDDLDEDAVVSALWHDKKVKADRLVFVLPKALDHVVVKNDVVEAELRSALRSLR
jgi:3-dehydroquinate synthase